MKTLLILTWLGTLYAQACQADSQCQSGCCFVKQCASSPLIC